MDLYSTALSLHMLGALGVLASLGLEGWSLRRLRRASTADQLRQRLRATDRISYLAMVSMLTQLASGGYMMAKVWGAVPWILVALAAMGLLFGLAMALTRPGMQALERAAHGQAGPLSPTLQALLHAPRLNISFLTRVAVVLGILVLMNAKPDLAGSLLTLSTATGLGLGASLLLARRSQTREKLTA